MCPDRAADVDVVATAATDDNAVLKYAPAICFLALIHFFIFIITCFIMIIRGVIFMNMNIISKYLQFLRKSNNYTQDDLAQKLDISRQAVSKWETGTTIPDLEVLNYTALR